MALHNLARMTSTTTGTGTLTLGSAVSGFLSFADAGVIDGETVTYAIRDGSASEIGRGVYTASGTTLSRATIYESTNGGNAINCSGNQEVFITVAAELHSGTLIRPEQYGAVGNGSTDDQAAFNNAIAELDAGRGGRIHLSNKSYSIGTTITIDEASTIIEGDGAGFNDDPNGESESLTGAEIKTSVDGITLGKTGEKLGAIGLRNLYIWGTGGGTTKGVNVAFQIDQPMFDTLHIGGDFGYGFYCNTTMDSAHFNGCSIDGVLGFGVYFESSSVFNYTTIVNCIFADNNKIGLAVNESATGKWLRVIGSSFIRNCHVSGVTNPSNVYWGADESVISGCVIRDAGRDSLNTTVEGDVDGIIIAGNNNVISDNIIRDNSGYGIRVRGNNNVIYGNDISGNTDGQIIIESGATGNIIFQPGVTVSDSGTGTVIVNGGRILLGTNTPSGTNTTTFSSIPGTYRTLEIEFIARTASAASFDLMLIQLNGDTTATNYRFSQSGANATGVADLGGADTSRIAVVSGDTSPSNSCGVGKITIPFYSSTTFNKQVMSRSAYRFDASTTGEPNYIYGVEWENTAAVTSITLVTTGNYASGSTFRLYGVM